MSIAGKYLTFSLHNEVYGVPIHLVREITGIVPITEVPNTPKAIKGVINLRGKIIPVMSLRGKFGFDEVDHDRNTCVIFVDVDHMEIGIIVDSVKEVFDFDDQQVEVSPNLGQDSESCVMGMGKMNESVVILVDLSRALSKEHLSKIVAVESNSQSQRKAG